MAGSITDVPVLDFQDENVVDNYNQFYDEVLMEEEVLAE